ncbi:MAG: hypothetical protein MJA27_33470, partial [Pseudanabaenales cyanobacterium]|nr:hypothetical protein [Pseudanabaenales cyanobacterium]
MLSSHALSCHEAYYYKCWNEDVVEWQIQISRANEAAARLLWPLCDTGIRKRLRHIHGPTLLIWGSE